MYKPTPFLVTSSGRSGSNFLLSLLDSHPRVRHIDEVFGESQLRNQATNDMINRTGPLRYLDQQVERRGLESNVGFKILYHQFSDEYAAKWGVDPLPQVRERILSDKQLKVIHLKRRNKLRIVVSVEVARVTGEYVLSDADRRNNDVQISIDPDECRQLLQKRVDEEKQFDELLADHPVHEIFYEDLCEQQDQQCEAIQSFLGLDPCRLTGRTIVQNIRAPGAGHFELSAAQGAVERFTLDRVF